MITTNDTFYIVDGSKAAYAGAAIYCIPRHYDDDANTVVEVQIIPAVDEIIPISGIELEFTNTELTAFTASGADDVAKFYNLVEQAVKDYFEGLTANSAVTFTIA